MGAGVAFLPAPPQRALCINKHSQPPGQLPGSEWGYHFCLLCKYLNGKWFNTTYGLIWGLLPGSCWLGEPHGCSPVEGAELACTTQCQVEVSSLPLGFADWQEAPWCPLFLVCSSWEGRAAPVCANCAFASRQGSCWHYFSPPWSSHPLAHTCRICDMYKVWRRWRWYCGKI